MTKRTQSPITKQMLTNSQAYASEMCRLRQEVIDLSIAWRKDHTFKSDNKLCVAVSAYLKFKEEYDKKFKRKQ